MTQYENFETILNSFELRFSKYKTMFISLKQKSNNNRNWSKEIFEIPLLG